MKAVAKTVDSAENEARFDHIRPLYHEALTLVERLHRRLLDVIKDEFDRRGRAGEKLYVIVSANFSGLVIYTKGKFGQADGQETYYVLISSKRSQ